MRTIGVRELRQHASRHLQLVEGGQALRVVSRGRTVAMLVPAKPAGGLAALRSARRISPAARDLMALGAAVQSTAGVPRPSELLRRARDDER